MQSRRKIKITEVQITLIKPNNGLIAIASVVFDNNLYLGSIGVHRKLGSNQYRITYPTKQVGDRNFNIHHPINQEASEVIETAIIDKIKEVFEKCNENYDRHSNINNT